jgi:hypothetical protein
MVDGYLLKRSIDIFKGINIEGKCQIILHALILMTMSLLMAVHLYYRSPNFPFSPDSAHYIEQAKNLVMSGSTMEAPYGLMPGNTDQIEDGTFPIGFALVLALVSVFGVDAKDAAVAIGHLSALLLPWILYFCFRKGLGSTLALVVAGLSLMSPGILINSRMGLTDVFALSLAVGAIGLTLNSRSMLGFIFGGLLAGMAYAVRNAHLALLTTIALYYCYLLFTSNKNERWVIYRIAAGQLFGVAIIVLPLLIRNLFLFGSFNPYQMPPSTIGFIENLRTYIEALIKDVTACSICALYTAWSIPGLLMLAAILSCACWLAFRAWRNLGDSVKNVLIISGIYISIGSCLVVMARTRYQWGEVINIRHTLQYTPFLLAVLLTLVSKSVIAIVPIRVTLVVVLILFHVSYAFSPSAFQEKDPNYANLLRSVYITGKNHLCMQDSEVYLVSNWAYVFRIECDARVRQIEPINHKEAQNLIGANEGYVSLMDAITDIKDKSTGRPIHVGIFPGRFGLKVNDFPLQDAEQKKLLDSGWNIIRNDERGLLIQSIKDSS